MSNQKPLPFTKDLFRYYWGEDDVPLCSAYVNKCNQAEANKRQNQPPFIKRRIIPTTLRLSESDRAPQLKIDEECTKVTGEKGYSMVRATLGINRGKYYYEVYINSMPEKTAARIGWGQRYSNLQAPLGYDYFGYSWRSKLGTKFHQARGKTFDKNGGYREGDTIGCMIDLPFGESYNHTQRDHLPASVKKTCLIVPAKKKDTARILEDRDDPPNLNDMKQLEGSKISFYRNGIFIGVAFENVFNGSYYPSISLYKNCVVSANFGPVFKYPPEKFNESSKDHLQYRPANDIVEVSIIDNLLSDLLFIRDEELRFVGEKNFLMDSIDKSIG